MKKVGCFSILVAAAVLTFAVIAKAQQPKKIARIGYVSTNGNPNNPGPNVETFKRGLQDLGYTEGSKISIEIRYIEGKMDRTPGLVAELLQLKVDVIVVNGLTPVRLAKQATKTVPIVMVTTQDPIATGLIDSLARPGGNRHGSHLTRPRPKRKTIGVTQGGCSEDIACCSTLECG